MFLGERGRDIRGDIAVDNISVRQGVCGGKTCSKVLICISTQQYNTVETSEYIKIWKGNYAKWDMQHISFYFKAICHGQNYISRDIIVSKNIATMNHIGKKNKNKRITSTIELSLSI